MKGKVLSITNVKYTKAEFWQGGDLEGSWEFTVKLDGVRALWDGELWLSRSNKPLYNMPPYTGLKDVEVYCGSFKETIQKTRTKNKKLDIKPEELYSLDPIDSRLFICTLTNPKESTIKNFMWEKVRLGYEGMVLRQGNKWLKIKPYETYDVKVISQKEGKGKYAGKLGAVYTEMGKIGTGFTDEERLINYVGKTIEVECMFLTPAGKFRHPRFIRERPDK